jgi:hypothetical protein
VLLAGRDHVGQVVGQVGQAAGHVAPQVDHVGQVAPQVRQVAVHVGHHVGQKVGLVGQVVAPPAAGGLWLGPES